MIGKLLKYEMRSMSRRFLPVWAALLATSLVTGFLFTIKVPLPPVLRDIFGMLSFIPPMLLIALFVAVFVLSVLYVIQGFWKGLLGEEGYLMFTLPVSPHHLLISKGLSTLILLLFSTIVGILSILLLTIPSGEITLGSFVRFFRELGRAFGHDPRVILLIVEVILLIVIGWLCNIYYIYFAMAIGQLSNKHRGLMAVGAYFGINIILSIIMSIVLGLLSAFPDTLYIFSDYLVQNVLGASNAFLSGLIAYEILLLAVFYAGTAAILKRRLNLE